LTAILVVGASLTACDRPTPPSDEIVGAEDEPVTRGLRNRLPGTWRGRLEDPGSEAAVDLEATDETLAIREAGRSESKTWEVLREYDETLVIRTTDADGDRQDSALRFEGTDSFRARLGGRGAVLHFRRVGGALSAGPN
jgi:hypothetical protein